MLLVLQVPVSDLRGFVSSSLRLSRPSWPTPLARTEFIRSFGGVVERRLGGVESLVGENIFCNAKRGLLFENCPPFFTQQGAKIRIKVLFRRFFFDGLAVGKFEIGFVTKNRGVMLLPRGDVRNLIDHILNFQCRNLAHNKANKKSMPLGSVGGLIADAIAIRSSNQAIPSNFVKAGAPLLFLESRIPENIERDVKMRPVPVKSYHADYDLLYWNTSRPRTSIPTWWYDKDDRYSRLFDDSDKRKLRICLMRLHAEHEVLRQTLDAIERNVVDPARRSPESNLLQKYLNDSTKRISVLRKQAGQISQTDVAEIASLAMHEATPGKTSALVARLEQIDVRLNILRKVESYRIEEETRRKEYNLFLVQEGATVVNTKYENKGNVGAMGDHASAQNFTQNLIQTYDELKSEDLARDLTTLAEALQQRAKDSIQQADANLVAEAAKEAKKDDKDKVLSFLKKVGAWTADVAKEISVKAAEIAIKVALGLPG